MKGELRQKQVTVCQNVGALLLAVMDRAFRGEL
jgi:hypothetical protein